MSELGSRLGIVRAGETLVLDGEIDAHTAPLLARELATGGAIEVDVRGVSFIDSSGLRALILATERARDAGGDVVLVAPSTAVRRLIEITGLTGFLTIEGSAAGPADRA
jgi:anti-anti-sigma factor